MIAEAELVERLAAELDYAEASREAEAATYSAPLDWPTLSRRIMAAGGISPYPFAPDRVPGGLVRRHGTPLDVLAADMAGERLGCWADGETLLDDLQRAWAEWHAASETERRRAADAAPIAARAVSHAAAAERRSAWRETIAVPAPAVAPAIAAAPAPVRAPVVSWAGPTVARESEADLGAWLPVAPTSDIVLAVECQSADGWALALRAMGAADWAPSAALSAAETAGAAPATSRAFGPIRRRASRYSAARRTRAAVVGGLVAAAASVAAGCAGVVLAANGHADAGQLLTAPSLILPAALAGLVLIRPSDRTADAAADPLPQTEVLGDERNDHGTGDARAFGAVAAGGRIPVRAGTAGPAGVGAMTRRKPEWARKSRRLRKFRGPARRAARREVTA